MNAREPKPDWHDVPEALREKLSALVGSPIATADIVWGGYGPSATFALTTAAGSRFFCKGTHPGQTELGHKALIRERENYARFPELSQFGPAYRGGVDHGDWHMAVLDYVPRRHSVPPWSRRAVDETLKLIADFHSASPGHAAAVLPSVTSTGFVKLERGWGTLLNDAEARDRFLALFVDGAAAAHWFAAHGERLAETELRSASLDGPESWLHQDIRSDNIVFAERPMLVDWPMLSYGATLIDVAAFLPSLEGEGGPRCADGLRLYEEMAGLAFGEDSVAIAATTVAGFFAARAGEPQIVGLPRLRWIQALQLLPALRWLYDCLDIDAPPMLRTLDA